MPAFLSASCLSALLGVLSLFVLGACASPPPGRGGVRDPVLEAAQQRFMDQAFTVSPALATRQVLRSWDGPAGTVEVQLIAPAMAGRYPLIIYLPGLGERVDAAEAWRKTWAEAGFAVVSVQDRGDATPLLASEAARRGDIPAMVREANTLVRRDARLRSLQWVWQRLEQEADPQFTGLDFSRVAVAGFDTGAFSALAFSGEQDVSARLGLEAKVKAVIAISPALASDFQLQGQYAKARIPVLHVSSERDFDDDGFVTDIGMRVAAFHDMPRQDKYLLMFKQLGHRELGGDFDRMRMGGEPTSGGHRGDAGQGRGRGGRSGNGPPGGGRRGQGGAAGSPPSAGEGRGPQNDRPGGNEPAAQIMRSVTLAFLQSHLRDDAAALDWLCLDAPRWLRPQASLAIK